MRPRYARSRWNAAPIVRPVVNTDGEVLRKVEMRPAVFLSRVTTLQFRKPARVEGGKLVGPQDYSRPRPEYYVESGAKRDCLCRVAGSQRCPIRGHERREIPPPAAWPYDVPWDDTVGLRPKDADVRAVDATSGARLIRVRPAR